MYQISQIESEKRKVYKTPCLQEQAQWQRLTAGGFSVPIGPTANFNTNDKEIT